MPLFDRVGAGNAPARQPQPQTPAPPFRDQRDMMAQAQAFRGRYQGSQEDARREVEEMLRSGKISPQMLQFGQALVSRFFGGK